MDWGQVLGAAAVLMTLLSTGYVGMQRGRIVNLREQVDDERRRVDSLKAERADLQASVQTLSSEMAALRGVVTGEVHWTSINDLLEHHHQLAEQHWSRAETTLNRLLDKLEQREA